MYHVGIALAGGLTSQSAGDWVVQVARLLQPSSGQDAQRKRENAPTMPFWPAVRSLVRALPEVNTADSIKYQGTLNPCGRRGVVCVGHHDFTTYHTLFYMHMAKIALNTEHGHAGLKVREEYGQRGLWRELYPWNQSRLSASDDGRQALEHFSAAIRVLPLHKIAESTIHAWKFVEIDGIPA